MMSAELALRLVALLLAVAISVISLELGILLFRGQLDTGGLFDWRILRLRRTITGHTVLLRPLDMMFSSRIGTALWLLVGPLAAIVSVVTFGESVGLIAAFILVAFELSLALRLPVGRDGADQLVLIFSLAVFAYQLAPSITAARLVLYMICASMTASYTVASVSKLTSVAWRRGSALFDILRSSCYGNPVLAAHINSRVAYAPGIGIAIFETVFLLIWVMNGYASIALVILGIMFHLGVWLIMGLNSFFFTFAAGYPALFWLVTSGIRPFGIF